MGHPTTALARFLDPDPALAADMARRDPILGGIGDRLNAAIDAEVEARLSRRARGAEFDQRISDRLDRSAEHDAACLREIDRLPSLRAGLAEHCAAAVAREQGR